MFQYTTRFLMAKEDFASTFCVDHRFQTTQAGLETATAGDRHRQFGSVDFGRPVPAGQKPRHILRWVLAVALAIAIGLALSVAQMRHGTKNDIKGVKDGDLPKTTLMHNRT